MPSPAEIAARTYVAAWQESDPAARVRLIEACFAADGRIVTPGTIIRGRGGVAKAVADLFADPRGLSARLTSAIDAQGPMFRFRSVVADREGRVVFDGFDAGEVDGDGRIIVLLAFGGAPPAPRPETDAAD